MDHTNIVGYAQKNIGEKVLETFMQAQIVGVSHILQLLLASS